MSTNDVLNSTLLRHPPQRWVPSELNIETWEWQCGPWHKVVLQQLNDLKTHQPFYTLFGWIENSTGPEMTRPETVNDLNEALDKAEIVAEEITAY